MTLEEQKRIVYIAGMLGYMMNEDNFKDVYGNREISAIVQNLEKLLTKISVDGWETCYKKVLKGDLTVQVVNMQDIENNKRKMLKSQTAVNRESLYTISEHAMTVCEDCKRTKSKCSLRKALMNCNIPSANEESGKCQYNWKE